MSCSIALLRMFKTLAPAAAITLAFVAPSAHADWGWGKKITGSGNIKTESRTATGFSGIALAVAAKVELRQGNTEAVSITGDDNIVALVETVVEDGKLKIRWNERNISTSYKELKITIDAKTVESLSISGSGDINADSINAKDFSTSISGSGDVRIKTLSAEKVNAKISGSGDVTLGGKAGKFEGKINGSGDIKAGNLETRSASVSIAGSGNATVWANDALAVSVAGSGDVRYYGDATVSKSVAGSGSVKRIGKSPSA